ncbi:MAG: hypothetical protein M1320_02320 [Patescibacteria group bacterium]|nr:hypothetical protein [Patescibacteria group bacterium]
MKRNLLIIVGLILLSAATAFAVRVFVFVGPVVISVIIIYFAYAFAGSSGQFLASSFLICAAMLLGFVLGVQRIFKPYLDLNPDSLSLIIFIFVAFLILENFWFYLRMKQAEDQKEGAAYDDI